VQDFGWLPYVSNGVASGSTGQSKRAESIKIKLDGVQNGGVRYSTHVQDVGWTYWSFDGEPSGSIAQSKRIEAIKICLTGGYNEAAYSSLYDVTDMYDVYYCVHVESIGWMGWAKNGEPAGTEGYGLRAEAICIRLWPKGTTFPYSTSGAYMKA
jgi:uncharacterized protein YjdB